ncbi:GTP cyclohydrolase II [Macrococcus hajekii]|uniref:GTP cyclohydrolase-2 n=1 Tax=Macrococcus hajekii TaxID=198482 RepID=A0A4R6BLX2_9STAP|nr:GTP cyclohydrolase II [Macrococcus hajekii]TDM02637.1 GTP cyclohydrolase II [Macrococcus hajekii]GGB02669.1 riboflavin biosynthesis protein RibBA [Macrococcus hajekii]
MFDRIEDALINLRMGKPVIVVDSEDRENEGDLVAVTEFMKPEVLNMMITEARGLVCAPVSEEIAAKFNLAPMTIQNNDPHGTAFTASIDHVTSTTGISVNERYDTVRALLGPDTACFNSPGHIFPLIARDGGVLIRQGHTEACVDLATLCGAQATGVICEIIKEDGTMARRDDLVLFKQQHDLKMITIEALVHYRKKHEALVGRAAVVDMPTLFGHFTVYGYEEIYSDKEHVVYMKPFEGIPDVRLHSECLTGDVFHSKRCDCGVQLENGLRHIEEQGGLLIYLRQEGRGIGLINKLKAYEKIEQGLDTVEANAALGFEADLRDYGVAASILKDLEIPSVNLITNNPRKIKGLERYGIDVRQRIPHQFLSNPANSQYLATKKDKLGHLLEEKLI